MEGVLTSSASDEALDRADGLRESLDRVTLAISEATAELLKAVADGDDEGMWRADGATSMAAWLAARYGVAMSAARELVRVGHALRFLPRIAEAHASGRLSWDQLRPLTRFATPETDEAWAIRGSRLRPSSLWKEAARHERIRTEVVEEVRRLRSLSMWWDPERPILYLEGTLPAEEGAAVEAALRRASREITRDVSAADPEGARMADAFVQLVTSSPADGSRVPPTMVVHASAEVLTREDDTGPWLAETESGVRLPSEAIRRLACDARIDWVLEAGGSPTKIGTQGRSVPDRIRQALLFRDHACRFPGCENRRFIDAHHIVHWADGGPTTIDNLVILCDAHHRLIHEGGWRISGHPAHDFRFHDPSGRRLEVHPEPRVRSRAAAARRRE